MFDSNPIVHCNQVLKGQIFSTSDPSFDLTSQGEVKVEQESSRNRQDRFLAPFCPQLVCLEELSPHLSLVKVVS